MALSGTQSLEKALRLLRQVAVYDVHGIRLADLVRMLGVEQSTAHRLLQRLVREGLLSKDERSRYHLGRQVFELGLLAAHRFEIGEAAAAARQRPPPARRD
jgi:DNA-binding IclR family transcriptional regulator